MTQRSTKHPFTGWLYELTPDGNIQITDGDKRAIFSGEGRYISGDFKECDPQLCVWIANNPEANTETDADSHLAMAGKNRRSIVSPITRGAT